MLSDIAFLHPWVLSALSLLPVIWFVLRVVPPAPRLIHFPPARFFADIPPPPHATTHTPWWILLLRLLFAVLLVVMAARPVLDPSQPLGGSGPLYIVMDNGWASAQTWREQTAKAEDLIARAETAGRNIYIIPAAIADKPAEPSLLSPTQAKETLRGLAPQPWPVNADLSALSSGDTYWIGTGLVDGKAQEFLSHRSLLTVFGPEPDHLPVLLRPGAESDGLVESPSDMPAGQSLAVHAKDEKGNTIAVSNVITREDSHSLPVTFDLPPVLRADIARIALTERAGAGAVLLHEARDSKKSAFILSSGLPGDETPFVDGTFYLRRALEPFAWLRSGTMEDFAKDNPAVLIMPGQGALAPDERDIVADWVEKGGLLLRFADLAGSTKPDDLTPVPLRGGGRAMEGALTWETPQSLKPFPQDSPYFGIPIDSHVLIKRQVLPEPVPDIEKLTWAQLADGTPLITAAQRGKGLIVMIHTSSAPEGSDLPLSGMFVKILQETLAMAGKNISARQESGMLPPYLILEGMGKLQPPPANVKPISMNDLAASIPDNIHPPGLYGNRDTARVFNLGARLPELTGYEILPAGTDIQPYGENAQKDLRPPLLLVIIILFLADWGLMLLLQSEILFMRIGKGGAIAMIAIALCSACSAPARAQDQTSPATDLYLAYVSTSPGQDEISRAGLNALGETLSARTSAEVAGVTAVSPQDKDLALFPLLYWPIGGQSPSLSTEARHNIQAYLDRGGMIVFDTMEAGESAQSALREAIEGITLPALAQISDDQVLSRSFYLLNPRGLYGAIWAAENDPHDRDEVSPVIIMDANLAHRWAMAQKGIVTKTQEIDMRFGVNLVMYALTGNYKSDQVHLPAIMERLGR